MSPITTTPKSAERKSALSPQEIALVVAGLEAGAREAQANAATARRLGYTAQANGFDREAQSFATLARTAKSVRISRMTVRHN